MPWNSSTKSFKICRCCMKWRCKCLVPRQGKPLPPFNSGLKRDANIGMHPKFYQAASDAPGVGSYDLPALSTKSTARKYVLSTTVPKMSIKGPKGLPHLKHSFVIISWKKELETAEFSATMGGRLVEKYTVDRERMKTGLGPGIHEISQWPENILEKSCKTIRRDADFGTVHRFKPDIKSATPGPGYTKKNPYHYLDENKRRGLSCVPSFEYDGLRPRFSTILKPWSLPCNLYNAKYPETLEAFLKKVTGKRGPYDLFTGPRDERTLIGYQKSIKLEDRGEWPKSLPSELDKLLQKSNYFKGRWTTCPRFPKKSGLRLMLQDLALSYKDPSHPGPGHYNPKSPGKPKNAKNYPFNSNVDFVRPGPPFEIQPGPGRYRIKETEKIRGHGWTWVFKSKAPRTNFLITRSYRSF